MTEPLRWRVSIRPGFIQPWRCPDPQMHEGDGFGNNRVGANEHMEFVHGFVYEPRPPRAHPRIEHCPTCVCDQSEEA